MSDEDDFLSEESYEFEFEEDEDGDIQADEVEEDYQLVCITNKISRF